MQLFGLCVFVLFLLFSLVNGCGRRRRYRDRTAPTMSCPGDRTEVADKIQVNTKVTWSEPIAVDEKDGKITPRRTGPRPGSLLSEGSTQITYTATDGSGNYRSCHFHVTVTVTRCKFFEDVTDGWKICHPSHDMRRGGTCQFGCYEGHERQGPSSVTCQDSGLWTDEIQPVCKKLTCPTELPADLQTTIGCSNKNFYRSICTFSCVTGYDILPGFSRVKVCTARGSWNGPTPVCVDIKPPEFQNCTSIKTAYAERSRTTGRVWWDDPGVTDNSGTVHLIQTSGPKSGDELDVGQYAITYTAYDDVNNTAQCSFSVIVKQILCPSIYPLPYTSVVCPSGRRYGSTCVFACDNNTAINGQPETQCEKQGVHHYYGQWTFGDYQPYCTLTSTCPELSAPSDGALACDVWLDGRFCQTFCREGYLFNTQAGYNLHRSLLVCGDSGRWNPQADDLPDCVPETRVTAALFKLEAVYYFDGPCESAVDEIKEKFLTRFAATRGCEYPDKCIVKNVEVTCGNNTELKRKKRETRPELVVSAVIEVKPSSEDVAMELLEHRQAFRNALKTEDAGDSRLTYKSDNTSAPALECPDGYEPKNQEYKCAECSRGYYQDTESKACTKCPFGQYQPHSKRTSCLICTHGTTTVKKGSYDESQCLDACDPGYFSVAGIEPCSPCDVGYYSTDYGTRECTSCPGAQITQIGAKIVDECYDFDLDFKEEVKDPAAIEVPISDEIDTLAVSLWVQCTSCNNILSIADSDKEIISVREQENFFVIVNGQEYGTDMIVSINPLWKYIMITLSDTSVSVTINEEEILHELIGPQQQHSVLKVTAGGSGFLGSISRLNIWNDVSFDRNRSSAKCASEELGNVVSWKQFADTDGDFVQTYSKCDDFDNCLSGPCQNGGLCTDALGSYTCSCLTGYTGVACDTNIDDCLDYACDNGATCVDVVAGYNCVCRDGFTGSLCEIKVVDGGWSDWEDWGPCSVSCGSGKWTRYRTCSNPTPDNDGKQCEGDSWETSECVTDIKCLEDCDVDPTLENGDANCTWSDTTRKCRPFCNKGFDFDADIYLHADCGLDTGYQWSIKTNDNQLGQLPSCNEIKSATTNTMYYKGVYLGLDFTSVNDGTAACIKSKADDKVAQTPCVQNGRCKHTKTEVVADDNEHEERKKRETQFVSFVVYISCDLVTDIEECFNLLKDVKEMLDDFVQQLEFSVDVASTTYNVDFNSTSIDGVSTCDPGSASVYYYCVPCGTGMYQLEDYCEMCPRGTYQDEVGRTSCKDCSEGWSTEGLMSRDQSLCNVPVDIPSDSLAIWMIVLAVALPAVVCGSIVIVVLAYCRWYHHRQRENNSQANFHNNLPLKELTAANSRFDKSRLFTVEHPSADKCNYPRLNYPKVLTLYPPPSGPPPAYERPPSAPLENNFVYKSDDTSTESS